MSYLTTSQVWSMLSRLLPPSQIGPDVEGKINEIVASQNDIIETINSAIPVKWSSIEERPTKLSQFLNDLSILSSVLWTSVAGKPSWAPLMDRFFRDESNNQSNADDGFRSIRLSEKLGPGATIMSFSVNNVESTIFSVCDSAGNGTALPFLGENPVDTFKPLTLFASEVNVFSSHKVGGDQAVQGKLSVASDSELHNVNVTGVLKVNGVPVGAPTPALKPTVRKFVFRPSRSSNIGELVITEGQSSCDQPDYTIQTANGFAMINFTEPFTGTTIVQDLYGKVHYCCSNALLTNATQVSVFGKALVYCDANSTDFGFSLIFLNI